MSESIYIGVDLGGTRIRAARFNSNLEMKERQETLTRSQEGPDAVIGRIKDLIKAVWPTNGQQVEAIGVSAPGPINARAGVIASPPNLKGWINIPLAKILSEAFHTEAYLGNDANLAAVAEAHMGAAQGYRDVVFLTISTGIGSGIISDGKLLIGSEGIGDEVGHTILVVDGDQVSDFEQQAAGPAIARQARAAIEKGEKSKILDLANGSLSNITAAMVGTAAKDGEAVALRVVARVGWILGLGIVNMLHIFNPQIIVLGGGVSEGMGDMLLPLAWDGIRKYSMDPLFWKHLIIAPAQLGENVSLIGAATLALHKGEE